MRSHSKALFAVAALFVFLLVPSSAVAVTVETRPHVFSFDGSDSDAGPFSQGFPSGIALHDGDERLYVVDRFFNSVIDKFDGEGVAQDFSTLGSSSLSGADIPPPDGPMELILGGDIAVDNSGTATDGNLYASKATSSFGEPALYVFAPDGTYLGKRIGVPGDFNALAVDSDGDVWTTDINAHTVRELDASLEPTGNVINVSAQGFPLSIAFDSADNLYVVQGEHSLEKYDSTGAHLEQIDAGGGGSFGDEGTIENVVVDLSDDHLFAMRRNRVSEYDATGALLDEFGLEHLDGQFGGPADIAVGAGDRVYVTERSVRKVHVFGPTTSITVADATATVASDVGFVKATLEGILDPLGVPTGIRFQYRVQGESAWASTPVQDVGPTPGTQSVSASVTGLDDETTYEFRILAVNTAAGVQAPSNVATFATPAAIAPVVAIDPVTDVDSTSADFSGQVDPQGTPTSYRFQYATQADFSDAIGLPAGDAGEGVGFVPASASATNLQPNTDYHVRLVAENTAGSTPSSAEQFHTDAVPPTVEAALDPGPVTGTTAWLGANVNPKNAATTFYVEYSTSADFVPSISIPASEDASIGSGGELTLANRLVEGLQPRTTYHYRVVATNLAGTVTGQSRSFTTPDASTGSPTVGLPDGRVWEKVSPAHKASADIFPGNGGKGGGRGRAAIEGDAVAFYTANGVFGGEAGALFPQYLARRNSDGWVTQGLNPRQEPEPGIGIGTNSFEWFSRDLSQAILSVNAGLNPGDPNLIENLYMRNNSTGTYRTISDATFSTPDDVQYRFEGTSEDGAHVVFQRFSSDALHFPLVERVANGAVLDVSILPGQSEAVPAKLGAGQEGTAKGTLTAVSSDGSRIYFTPSIDSSSDPTTVRALYVREGGKTTSLVSASERSGDDPTEPRQGWFLGASRDGSVAYFWSSAALTNGSDEDKSLYRWDADAPEGERLSDLTRGGPGKVEVLGLTALSEDGASVYFVARGDLTGGTDPNLPNLYLWQEGEGLDLVATDVSEALWQTDGLLGGEVESRAYRSARITPDGAYLAFGSSRSLTAYDTNGKNNLYIYDRDADRLICASCGVVSARSEDHSWFLRCMNEESKFPGEYDCAPQEYLSRNLSADGGRLIFDSRDALVPHDTNGATDVYEWSRGSLHLLSSGTSAFPSGFIDASSDGDDVFFVTSQQLVPSDKDDLLDLYDARVGGATEPNIPAPCVADECQGTPDPPPGFGSPASSSFQGVGNVPRTTKPRCRKSRTRRHCRKGKAKRKVTKHGARKAGTNRKPGDDRRAGR